MFIKISWNHWQFLFIFFFRLSNIKIYISALGDGCCCGVVTGQIPSFETRVQLLFYIISALRPRHLIWYLDVKLRLKKFLLIFAKKNFCFTSNQNYSFFLFIFILPRLHSKENFDRFFIEAEAFKQNFVKSLHVTPSANPIILRVIKAQNRGFYSSIKNNLLSLLNKDNTKIIVDVIKKISAYFLSILNLSQLGFHLIILVPSNHHYCYLHCNAVVNIEGKYLHY